MKDSKDLEEEIHAVRYAFYEKTKNMSPAEMNAYINAQVEPIEKKFGIKAIDAPPVREHKAAL